MAVQGHLVHTEGAIRVIDLACIVHACRLSVQDEAHAAAVNALSSHQTQGLELVAAAEASKAALQEEVRERKPWSCLKV